MNIRVTRIAVTLCLTISMMFQQMLVFAAVAPCVDKGCTQETQTCSGCGCCEIEQLDDQCCCCSGTDSAESNAPRIAAVATEDNQVHGACNCGVSLPPMNHNGQRNELIRELALRVISVEYVAVADDHPTLSRPKVVDSQSGKRADFSQRILCVWRI
jgi:hypothetical protein